LVVVGLVEEVPDIDMGMSSSSKASNNTDIVTNNDTNGGMKSTPDRTPISNSFLQSLVGFLQHKA
jgi:hypothetical protein